MADKREAILIHLFQTLGTIQVFGGGGTVSTWRNRGELKEDKRPALVLLDGAEITTQTQTPKRGRLMMGMPPVLVSLRPQIFVLLVPRELPTNLLVGEELNYYRLAVMNAISNDMNLFLLLGDHGQVTYLGCDTDLKTGGNLEGQAQLNFSIAYVLNPMDP